MLVSVRTTSGERVADDPTNTNSGSATPPPAQVASDGEPLGIRAQIGATFEAVKRLVRAHVDLAKTEMSEIVDEVKRMVGLFAVAFFMILLVGMLFLVGGLLFLGEWLFGSIGWGVLLGSLLLLDVALSAALAALDVSAKRIVAAFGAAAILGIVVGVVMALDLTHRGWTALGDAVAAQFDPNTRAVLLAIGITAAVGAVLGLLWGLRSGGAGGKLFAGAVSGALLGGLTVISIPGTVGAALGVLVALIAWPVLAGRDVMRTGIDGDALKKKFTPEATIELTKETIEWVRARTPLVPKS
jgi:hypothetical protein